MHDLIYHLVRLEYSEHGAIELGDPRVRAAKTLTTLGLVVFVGARIDIEPEVFNLHAAPDVLAREAAGLFYASHVAAAVASPDVARAGNFLEGSAVG